MAVKNVQVRISIPVVQEVDRLRALYGISRDSLVESLLVNWVQHVAKKPEVVARLARNQAIIAETHWPRVPDANRVASIVAYRQAPETDILDGGDEEVEL